MLTETPRSWQVEKAVARLTTTMAASQTEQKMVKRQLSAAVKQSILIAWQVVVFTEGRLVTVGAAVAVCLVEPTQQDNNRRYPP